MLSNDWKQKFTFSWVSLHFYKDQYFFFFSEYRSSKFSIDKENLFINL